MNGYLALININLKLALREKGVLFFNYVFPLIFFFAFGQMFGAASGAITQIVAMVLVLGMLGGGLFGAGMRAVAEREANILRRYKVAPITPAPILVASMVTGWILYLPSAMMTLALAHFVYGMPLPERWLSLLLMVTVGTVAMRSLGLIIASVVNSVAESNILIQTLYMPMLFLSGATFPVSMLPSWAQIVGQFLPATYLFSGMQGIVLRRETLAANAPAVGALVLTVLLATFISIKLFRWEKEERIAPKAKAWVLAVLLPFFALGAWQSYSRDNIQRTKLYERDIRRARTTLIKGARIFVGDGQVIESGSVLIRQGRIAEVWKDTSPDADKLRADLVEAFGKTLLPGLIDTHVHLGSPGGVPDFRDYDARTQVDRALAAYLFCGVTAVKSAGDFTDLVLAARRRVAAGERLGAELFVSGPLFTAEGGHGTEYFKDSPEMLRRMAEQQFTRLPKNPAEAATMVRDLKAQRVDGIKAVLESGAAGFLFNRMDKAILKAIAGESRAQGLPLVVHTGVVADIMDAVDAGARAVEHGASRETFPEEDMLRMIRSGVTYNPTLSVIEGIRHFVEGRTDLLDRSLMAQVGPQKLLENTRAQLNSPEVRRMRERMGKYPMDLEKASDNAVRVFRNGGTMTTGSDAGNGFVMHGPTVHRELQLMVKAGIPEEWALRAATSHGARLVGALDRIGLVQKGFEANLLLVDGNPLKEIQATERISAVYFRGERINRSALFDQK